MASTTESGGVSGGDKRQNDEWRTTTYIDEVHEFRSKSESGVSAVVSLFNSCYSNRFTLMLLVLLLNVALLASASHDCFARDSVFCSNGLCSLIVITCYQDDLC